MRHLIICAVAALAVSGCAGQWLEHAQALCQGYGLAPGTPEYSACVERDFNRRDAAFRQAMRNLQNYSARQQTAYPGRTVTCVDNPLLYGTTMPNPVTCTVH